MLTETEVSAALDDVIHPSFGLSLMALDMVHAVRVSDNLIEVDLRMNCPGCPAGEVALARARQRLSALINGDVQLTVLPETWTPPWE